MLSGFLCAAWTVYIHCGNNNALHSAILIRFPLLPPTVQAVVLTRRDSAGPPSTKRGNLGNPDKVVAVEVSKVAAAVVAAVVEGAGVAVETGRSCQRRSSTHSWTPTMPRYGHDAGHATVC